VLRLRHLSEIHPAELFGQLCIELAAWSTFLYFTGGATNPLISLLLPLVAIGAATLRRRGPGRSRCWRWRPTRCCGISTSSSTSTIPASPHWHLAGMWLTFAVSAGSSCGTWCA
jgi:two-component system sensor histidine kinase RegB